MRRRIWTRFVYFIRHLPDRMIGTPPRVMMDALFGPETDTVSERRKRDER